MIRSGLLVTSLQTPTMRTRFGRGAAFTVGLVDDATGACGCDEGKDVFGAMAKDGDDVGDAGFSELGDLILDQSCALPRQQRLGRFHAP